MRPASVNDRLQPMKIFDSHCHLDDNAYREDVEAVLQRAADAGVLRVMVAGVNESSSRRAVALAEKWPGVYAAVGIHPHDARDCKPTSLATLSRLAQGSGVRAWGEIGLDFNRMYSPVRAQENCLVRQLELSRDAGLPVIFHERDSGGRFIELLEAHFSPGRQGVVHCFSGTPAELDRYLALGLHIGITGILTHSERGADLRRMVPAVPDDRLLIETDAPYLTPAPEKNRTRRNEPAFVRTVLLKLAALRKTAPETLADILWQNTCRLFRLPA